MGNSNGKPVVFTDEGGFNVYSAVSSACPLLENLHPLCKPLCWTCSLITIHLPIVNLNHFRLLRVVGKGAFGKVRIVERKDTGLTFALKYIRKDEGWYTKLTMHCFCEAYISSSRSVRKCAEYHPGAEDAGTSQSPVPVQSAI